MRMRTTQFQLSTEDVHLIAEAIRASGWLAFVSGSSTKQTMHIGLDWRGS